MSKLKQFYDEKYSKISVYAIKAATIIMIIGIFVFWLSGRVGGFLTFVGAVLKPLVLGFCFSYLLSPITAKIENGPLKKMEKESTRRLIAVLITFVIVFMVIALILSVIVATVTQSLSLVKFDDIKDFVTALTNQFDNFWETVRQTLEKMNINIGNIGNMAGKFFSGAKSAATTLLFAVIFSVYFLLDRRIGKYWGGVLIALTNESQRKWLREFAEDADRVFSGYIRGQALDALLVGTISSIALFIAGVPYGLVIGILTGIGNLIPYVGPIVGYASLIIVCLANQAYAKLVVGAIILVVVLFIDGNVINPRLLSNAVEVHPVLVIVALLAGGRVGGIVGMLVAVPIAALIKIQFEKYMKRKRGYDPQSYEDIKPDYGSEGD